MQVTVKSVDGRDQMFQRWPAFTWPHTLSTAGSSSDVAHVLHPLREPGYSWCTRVNVADITVGRLTIERKTLRILPRRAACIVANW